MDIVVKKFNQMYNLKLNIYIKQDSYIVGKNLNV